MKQDVFLSDDWNSFLGSLFESSGRSNTKKSKKRRLTQNQLDDWYSKDAIAAKICDKPAEEMIKQGIDIDHKQSKKIYDLYDTWDIYSILEDALKFDNVYGGSAIIFDIDDGLDWSDELNVNNIRALNDIIVVDRFFLTPQNYSYLKKPEYYLLSEKNIKIHPSRMCIFTGINSGIRNNYYNQSFGESRLFRVIEELENYSSGHSAITEILSRFIENIFKFNQMNNKLGNTSEKDKDLMLKKVSYLNKFRDITKALMIDKDDDVITRTLNVSGIHTLINAIERRLCAAAGMPHTKLLEESPGGGLTNNGNNSEQSKQWNDWIKAQQVKKLTLPYKYINMIFSALLKLGKAPIKFEFNPLTQQSQSEIIKDRNLQADTDKKYIEMGIPASLLLEKRFGNGYYSHETTLSPEEIQMIKDKGSKVNENIIH